jgi:hypothetical protein
MRDHRHARGGTDARQPRGTRRPLECGALEDGNLRLARVGRRRGRPRDGGRNEEAHGCRGRAGRVRAGRADSGRRRFSRCRRRERARAVAARRGRLAGVQAGRRSRRGQAEDAPRADERPQAGDLEGPPLGSRAVRHEGPGSERRQAGPAGSRRGCRGARDAPGLHHRGVRRRECESRAERDDRQGLLQGRAALGPAHVRDPVACLRRLRGGGRARAARVLGRSGGDRALEPRQPRSARVRRDGPRATPAGRRCTVRPPPPARRFSSPEPPC